MTGILLIAGALICGALAAILVSVRPPVTRPADERVRDACTIPATGGAVRLYFIDGMEGAGFALTYQAAGSDLERSFFEAWGGAAIDDIECRGDTLIIHGHVVTDQWQRAEREWTLSAGQIEGGAAFRCIGVECAPDRGIAGYVMWCIVPLVGLLVVGVLLLSPARLGVFTPDEPRSG
jgi:hypothetical protein